MTETNPEAYKFTLYGVFEGEVRIREERVSMEQPKNTFGEIKGLHPRNIRPLYEPTESNQYD